MHNSRFKFLQIKFWDRISTKDVQRRQSGLKSGEVMDPGLKKSIFPGKFSKISISFRPFHTKILIFSCKNWSFTATSGQIILFLFKSHHFRTYFLYMISYNNMSRPVHDPLRPHDPLPKIWWSRPPTPQD